MKSLGLLFFSFLFVVHAQVAWSDISLKPDKIKAASGIFDWKMKIGDKGRELVKKGKEDEEGLTECRETQELPGVILCLSFFQNDMNKIFGRTSIFAEGGFEVPKGTIVPFDNDDLKKLNKTTQGHDILSPTFFAFSKAVTEQCQSSDCKMDLTEQKFFQNVLEPIHKQYNEFVVLGFSHQAFDTYQSNVGHELLHAQYFVTKAFRDTVEAFWTNQISKAEKVKIRAALADEGYDQNDEALMRNEFQAYMLEPGAETSRLKEFVPLYRQKLKAALAKKGLRPILVR